MKQTQTTHGQTTPRRTEHGRTKRTRIRHARAIGYLAVAATLVVFACAWLSCSSRDKTPPNVILIVVDALRPDFLGCYGYNRPTSPNIDALARRGVVFETAIAHAPWTKTSFATMLTSLYPFQHGVVDWESVMPDTVATLPDALAEGGYSTLAVINMLGITGEFKVTRGFEQVSEAAKRSRDAFGTTQDAIDLIKAAPRPFFILVHYFDTHWPYRPGPEYLDRVRLDGDPDPFAPRPPGQGRTAGVPADAAVSSEKLLYSACIRLVDDAVGKLVGFLDEAGLRKNSVVLVTADHGEAFWEHGVGSHGGNLYEEAIRVPLVISYPAKYRHPKRVRNQVRHVDLAPTIMDLAGVADKGQGEGGSLRWLMEGVDVGAAPKARVVPGDVALCESSLRKAPATKCVRTDRFKLIIEPATGLSEFFNLANDPLEKVRIPAQMVAEADYLERTLGRIPGSSVEGWRVAVTGEAALAAGGDAESAPLSAGAASSAETLSVKVKAEVSAGGRITYVDRVSTPGKVAITVAPDSGSVTMEASPAGLQIMIFAVDRPDAEVTFGTSASGQDGPIPVYAGPMGETLLGEPVTVDPAGAFGLPSGFEAARKSPAPAAHIWYLRGEPIREVPGGANLSPDARERLKSLGYIQ